MSRAHPSSPQIHTLPKLRMGHMGPKKPPLSLIGSQTSFERNRLWVSDRRGRFSASLVGRWIQRCGIGGGGTVLGALDLLLGMGSAGFGLVLQHGRGACGQTFLFCIVDTGQYFCRS